ncbi:hypothetical protein BV898_04218 [Hypsibius exemplaris]|uniref:Uncharacterized protein n=1 Tax=Hypsibius exemplaris TaxID=2072580 RepID=A0A1W0X3K9_HYPEX|nr:hypothetical protein BV898_04218 [Hypsibius exemplaris]
MYRFPLSFGLVLTATVICSGKRHYNDDEDGQEDDREENLRKKNNRDNRDYEFSNRKDNRPADKNGRLGEFKLEQQGIIKPVKRLGSQNLPSARCAATVRKVKYLVFRPNPYSIPQIQQQLGLSYSTVWRIINQNLAAEKRVKRKTHLLSDKHVAQRVLKVPRLLEHLKGGKWRYIVSFDEAWCYMSHVNGRRRIYYKFREQESPQSWLKYCRQTHPRGVMFVAGISARGPTAIRFLPPRTKVNSDFYVKHVLKPLLEKDIPRLYGTDAKYVALHHDSAAAHTALGTVVFPPKQEVPIYSCFGLALEFS